MESMLDGWNEGGRIERANGGGGGMVGGGRMEDEFRELVSKAQVLRTLSVIIRSLDFLKV